MSTTIPSFSPLRCLPRWLVVPLLLFAVGGFFLGRWLNALPSATVKAMHKNKEVEAEVYRDGKRVGKTPWGTRGRRGEDVKLILKYEDGELPAQFRLEKRGQVEPFEFYQVAVGFCAYDTNGKDLPAGKAFIWTEGTKEGEANAMPAHLHGLVGREQKVYYKCVLPQYAEQGTRSETAQWHDQAPYEEWIQSEFLRRLRDLDPDYPREKWSGIIKDRLLETSGPNRHDYPLLFVAPERYEPDGDGGDDGGENGGENGGEDGGIEYWGTWEGHPDRPGETDDPTTNYWATDITLKREHLEDKTPQQRATMRNEIFWRQGYVFTQRKYWPEHFKELGIPRSASLRDLKGYEEANCQTIEQVELSKGGKWSPPY